MALGRVHEWELPEEEREAFRAQQYRESHPKRYHPPAPEWHQPPPSPPKVKTKLLYAFHEGVMDSAVREDKRERHRKQLAEVGARPTVTCRVCGFTIGGKAPAFKPPPPMSGDAIPYEYQTVLMPLRMQIAGWAGARPPPPS